MAQLVTVEQRNHLLLIGIDRVEKKNAWNLEVIQGVARAYTDLANDPALRVGVVFAHGDDFTAGLVSEVVPVGEQLERAVEVAEEIAANAPLAVQAALAGHRSAERAARDAAGASLRERAQGLFTSQDAAEGVAAMIARRDPVYRGE